MPRDRGALNHAPTDVALVALAVTRIRASAAQGAPIVVFVSGGAGRRIERAVDALRNSLTQVPTVTLASESATPRPPVADPNHRGGHVHTTEISVTPWPTIVVWVSESESNPSLFISARPPGRDPLGPADQGWAWMLSSP